MKYNYYFATLTNPELLRYLDEHQTKYKVAGRLVTFSTYSSDRYPSDRILDIIDICKGQKPVVYVEYTKKEINNAEYLWLRPQSQVVDICNSQEAYHYSCHTMSIGGRRSKHAEQVRPLQITKEPKQSSKIAFWSPDTGFSEIFADRRVVRLAIEHDLRGIIFNDVVLPNGCCSENIYQVSSNNVLGAGSIAKEYGENVEICPQCGKESICIDAAYQFHFNRRQIPVGQDLFMTSRIIGPGIGHPIYVISHKFYELLHEAELTGKLDFAPIELV